MSRTIKIGSRTVPMPELRDVGDVARLNREVGGHWFDPDTLRFFGSRVGDTLYGRRYFTTSERSGFDYSSPRAYSVRFVDYDGGVENAGEFLSLETGAQARRLAERLAELPASAFRVVFDPYEGDETPEADSARRYSWRVWADLPDGPVVVGTTRNTRYAARRRRAWLVESKRVPGRNQAGRRKRSA